MRDGQILMSPKQWFETVFIVLCSALPVELIWSWTRWARAKQPRTLSATLSLTGLALATASALLAFLPFLYPGSFKATETLGVELSLAAVLFAACGAWRPNPLRWHALACGAGMFLFSLGVLVSG